RARRRDPGPARAAAPALAGDRGLQPRRWCQDPGHRRPVVPRPRHAAPDGGLGQHARYRPAVRHPEPARRAAARTGDLRDRAGAQSRRRCAARRPRSARGHALDDGTVREPGGLMNIFKAMAVKDVDEVTRTIPVIDFGPAFRGEPGGRDTVAAEVRRACESIGFFYLAGHGVSPRIAQAAFAASREFHALPLEEKLALKLNENNIGYLPVNQSMQRASTVHKATRPNFNES